MKNLAKYNDLNAFLAWLESRSDEERGNTRNTEHLFAQWSEECQERPDIETMVDRFRNRESFEEFLKSGEKISFGGGPCNCALWAWAVECGFTRVSVGFKTFSAGEFSGERILYVWQMRFLERIADEVTPFHISGKRAIEIMAKIRS